MLEYCNILVKALLVIVILSVMPCFNKLKAQSLTFQKIYVPQYSITAIPIFIIGNQEHYMMADIHILLTDSLGDMQWMKIFRIDGVNRSVIAINKLADNKFIATGKGFLAKFNQAFNNVQWVRDLSLTNVYFKSVLEYPQKDLILGSFVFNGIGQVPYHLVTRTDSLGQIKWSRYYKTEFGQRLDIFPTLTNDNGLLIAGNIGIDTNLSASEMKIGLIKLDSLGNVEFAKKIYTPGIPTSYAVYSVNLTTDGGYILSGSRNSHCYLLKLDSLVGIEWMKTYTFGLTDRGTWAEETSDGGFIFTGNMTGSVPGGSGQTGILVKTNSIGDVEWARQLGNYGEIWTGCVRPTTDNGYMISCRRPGGSSPTGVLQSFSFIKTDSLGYTGGCLDGDVFPIATELKDTVVDVPVWDSIINVSFDTIAYQKINFSTIEFDLCSPTGMNDIANPTQEISIFPNPNSGVFTLQLKNTLHQSTTFELYDMIGKLVYSQFIIPGSVTNEIHLENKIPPGVYLGKITSENKIYSNKIVITGEP